ncbi:SET domain-containing protein [Zopfia rhizophila CBS 207.26]|uniref:SET domain-containing protein n=1 Tax=Zopfia rhizophila CBS 207.26 TaxID=1314779 RepID=A0A6A6EJQ2_9PEZI|nr:SET domain-containing protein [Zopfia rhizophila CBS 207.26]
MSQNHPYRSLQLPGDAPFELKPSPGKGWGAFATRRINRGATILRERPLFVVRKSNEQITEEDVRTAFQHLPPSAKQQFSHLRDNACVPFTHMTEAFAENSFAISNSVGPQASISPVHGLFLLHSRFNHSCIPNSKIPNTNNEIIASFATRDIMAGEEITFCYNTDFECRNRHERHQALRFICDCKACLPGTPFQQLSDMRRTFIRGLQYLTLGKDLNGQKQGSVSPIIVDPKLKKAAEDFSIPLSSRLFYNLLVMYLLEEEGLLDDFMAERLHPSILNIKALFITERNARIATLAMAQETWLEKFCMALRLYGRADVADHAVAEGLRKLQGLSVEQ